MIRGHAPEFRIDTEFLETSHGSEDVPCLGPFGWDFDGPDVPVVEMVFVGPVHTDTSDGIETFLQDRVAEVDDVNWDGEVEVRLRVKNRYELQISGLFSSCKLGEG